MRSFFYIKHLLNKLFREPYNFTIVWPKGGQTKFRIYGFENFKKMLNYCEVKVVEHAFHHLEIRNRFGRVIHNFCYIPPIKNGLKYLKIVNGLEEAKGE